MFWDAFCDELLGKSLVCKVATEYTFSN